MTGCGGSSSTYFKCGAGYIRSKRDGTNGLSAPGYRCTSCRLAETGSTFVNVDGSSTSYQLSSLTGITQDEDTCKVKYSVSLYNNGSCDVDQEYTKSGVTKDANHTNNYNTNAYTLSKQTIKKSAANKYAENGNANANTRCSSCPSGRFSPAATTQSSVPTVCSWIPTRGEIVNGSISCNAGYFLADSKCVTCPIVSTSGGLITVSQWISNQSNPTTWHYGGTSDGGSGGATQCYNDRTGSNSYGIFSYVNHCYYSGSTPSFCIGITNSSSSCANSLTAFCANYMKGNAMSVAEYNATYSSDSACVTAISTNSFCFNDYGHLQALTQYGVFSNCSVGY